MGETARRLSRMAGLVGAPAGRPLNADRHCSGGQVPMAVMVQSRHPCCSRPVDQARRKGAPTRQRIIEGTAGVIREVGLGDTTLDDIRMRTATSKASCSTTSHPDATSCCSRSRSSRPTASCSTNNHTCPTSQRGSRGSDGKRPSSVAIGSKAQNLPNGRADVRARAHRPWRTGGHS
jgi:hypothetical protein